MLSKQGKYIRINVVINKYFDIRIWKISKIRKDIMIFNSLVKSSSSSLSPIFSVALKLKHIMLMAIAIQQSNIYIKTTDK